jgi:anti-sigma regulatory factor (Ser/Thr protein kinase)
LENTGGRALGLVEQGRYVTGRMVLAPGDALLLYTDGVTEAMDPGETLYTDRRLADFLAIHRVLGPRQLINDLVGDVKHFAGDAPQSDDITALALRYFGAGRDDSEIALKNQLSELDRLNQSLAEFGRRHGLSSKIMHDLNLALEEIVTNVISHGYTDDREHEISVRLSMRAGEVNVEVEDDGQPFNPVELPEPDTTQSLEKRAVGGLGIHLVRKLMDGLEYRREGERNFLTMKKKTAEL